MVDLLQNTGKEDIRDVLSEIQHFSKILDNIRSLKFKRQTRIEVLSQKSKPVF